jgi:hypothetical protein
MTNMENIKRSVGETGLNRQEIIHMRISTTNRFLTKTLQTLCCVAALTACSAWATVVTWQLNAGGTLGATQESSKAITARGFDQTPATDASHQYSFKSASQSAIISETSSTLADSLNKNVPASQTDIQATSQVSTVSRQPDSSSLFASTEAPARANTELDEAMARSFDEEFVSVPSVQFATTTPGAQSVSVAGMSSTASGPGPMPVPEMSALFPIVGLIVAISCTQILRRRRMAQQTAPR